jgi:chemotaxis protein CheY-P-specific phosphatase CheC
MEAKALGLLSEVFRDVLERVTYAFGDPAAPAAFLGASGRFVRAVMSFTGPLAGALEIAAPEALGDEMAASALGVDPDPGAAASGRDILKELLNVTCGAFLTALAGRAGTFDLTVPEIEDLDACGWRAALEAPGALVFAVEDRPILVHLSLQPERGPSEKGSGPS